MLRRLTIIFLFGGIFIFVLSAYAAGSVVVNEIQTTGAQDSDDEFIELWNGSDTAIALDDWSLQYKTATGTTINKRNFDKDAAIPAQGYYLIATKVYTGSVPADLIQSSVSLAKSGGNLYLVRNQEVVTSKDDPDIVDRVAWGTGDSAEGNAASTPDAGQSIARDGGADTNNNAKDFSIQATPKPKNTKTVTTGTNAPVSSESQTPTPSSSAPTAPPKKESVKEEKGALSITEILPNPVGSDEREFIELQNTGTAPLPLAGWRITNFLEQEYRFIEGALAPKEYRVLWREKSGLALQNDREELHLFAPDKDRATETVKFTDAPEGLSLMRGANDDLVWTTTPTPEEANRLVKERNAPHVILHAPKEGGVGELLNFDASDSFALQGNTLAFHWDFGDELGKGEGAQATYIYLKSGSFTIALTATDKEGMTATETQKIKISGENLLAEKKEKTVIARTPTAVGERSNPTARSTNREIAALPASSADRPWVARNDKRTTPLASGTIRGVVTVPPGVLAKTFMYILCETPCAGDGVKVRMTKAGWPALQKGDVVMMSGKASTANNEPSFLVKKENVHTTGARKQIAPEPLPSFRDIDDTLLRHFVIATGEITDKKGGVLYLDDGAGELSVAAKTSPLIAEGDKISITGILTKTEKGYVLKASEPATVINAQPKVVKSPTQIVRDKNSERMKYLVTTLAALLALGAKPVITLVQKRRKKNAPIV
ncbi:lamin tail domain-containing protein [Candidatus Uhrbacteria bacterium]|nr:lamin tail domain-containing protein [Candidatus Uhrbacteria bacterium]